MQYFMHSVKQKKSEKIYSSCVWKKVLYVNQPGPGILVGIT